MSKFDDLKEAVESLSGGVNSVILDDIEMPSIMVKIPKMLSSDLIAGATSTVHPAFIVNGKVQDYVYVSKYQNVIMNNRAYSLPYYAPEQLRDFDVARNSCTLKGDGWGLMPSSLWAAISLWSRANGTIPHGNNSWGHDVSAPTETGIIVNRPGEGLSLTLTGSGPATWGHDHTLNGICDMNGNVREWCDGLRLKNGEIQIIPNADCILAGTAVNDGSLDWRAILPDGTLVKPRTPDSLKYDYLEWRITISSTVTTTQSRTYGLFGDVKTSIELPQLIRELALFPPDTKIDDDIMIQYDGEKFPQMGGHHFSERGAGVFSIVFDNRVIGSSETGFRTAYYGGL